MRENIYVYVSLLVIFITYILFTILCRLSGHYDDPSDVGCQKRRPTLTAVSVGSCVPAFTETVYGGLRLGSGLGKVSD